MEKPLSKIETLRGQLRFALESDSFRAAENERKRLLDLKTQSENYLESGEANKIQPKSSLATSLAEDVRAIRALVALAAWCLVMAVLSSAIGGLHIAALMSSASEQYDFRKSEAYWLTFLVGLAIFGVMGASAWWLGKLVIPKNVN